MLTLNDHKRLKNVELPDNQFRISCSCGKDWVVSKLALSNGVDGFDAHVKEVTGKYPLEHD